MPCSSKYPSAVSGAAERPPHPQKRIRSASRDRRAFPHPATVILAASAMNFACFMKSSLCRNSPASVKMSPPLPKPKSYQSCFATFTRKEDVRSPLYGARYHSSLPLLLTGSCPSRARKSASGILLTASISVLSMPVSVDDELDTDPELRVELPCVATPKATLPQVGKQGDTVCHVTLHIERQRTAVDEGVPVVQRGAVMQHLLPQFTASYPARAEAPA